MNGFSLEFDSYASIELPTSVDFAVDSFADFDVEFSFFVEFVVGSEGKFKAGSFGIDGVNFDSLSIIACIHGRSFAEILDEGSLEVDVAFFHVFTKFFAK